MAHTALVTGADRGLGAALCAGLLERGWEVFAGQYMPGWPELAGLARRYAGSLHVLSLDVSSTESASAAARAISEATDHLDLLIHNAGVRGGSLDVREGVEGEAMHRAYDVNTLGAIRAAEAMLPLLDRGALKRLCFVSSEAGSVTLAHRTGGFGYCMSKAALNMAVKIMFNDLRPKGYTFRLYHPGWMRTYMAGYKSTTGDMEPDEAAACALPYFLGAREDEDRLTLIDFEGVEWPF